MSKDYNHTKYDSSLIGGNSIDVTVDGCDSEIKADIVISEIKSVRLWGQIKTCNGQPVANALLKLLKVVHKPGSCEYHGIAHTISDCKGFYQFDLCSDEIGCSYKILASKSTAGSERTLCHDGNCNPCENSCIPCDDCNFSDTPYECRPTKNCNCR